MRYIQLETGRRKIKWLVQVTSIFQQNYVDSSDLEIELGSLSMGKKSPTQLAVHGF